MYNFSNEAKERIVTGKIVRCYLKVLPTETKESMIINEENYLKDLKLEDFRFVPNEGFIGSTVAKRVTGNFNNISKDFSIQDREFELYFGVELENKETEYIKYGNFIVQKPNNNQVNDNTYFEALDYMSKLNLPWENRITYPCTLKRVFDDLVSQTGLTTKTTSFLNDDFIVDSNQFREGTTRRDVLKAIAQVAFSWARIDEDNDIVMDFEVKALADETINTDKYFKFSKQDEYGPLNVIVLRDSQIEGENVTIRDENSIALNGETELVIADNPFAYTEEKRLQLVQAGANIYGLRYVPMELDTIGLIYLNCKDKIRVESPDNQSFDTYLLNHTIDYQGTVLDSIESPAKTKTETKYQFLPKMANALKKTEILVDKQNQKITSVVKNVDNQNEKISKVEQSVNEINSKISDIADITTSKNSSNGILNFEKVNQSEPINVNIKPIGENISYLYPNSKLFPSDKLFSKIRTLRFHNLETNKDVDYELPANLLYYDSNNYDEFVLDYDLQICKVIKKVGYNADGTTYVLPEQKTTNYPYPRILLEDGSYEIKLLGYDTAYMEIRLMAQNIYTTQFATKAELNSEISQTTENINLSVNKKLSNYSTTSEMNSAIDVKAGSITSSVSKNYATKGELNTAKSEIKQTTDGITSTVSKKVGKDEIISTINQSAEGFDIDANKLNINRCDFC